MTDAPEITAMQTLSSLLAPLAWLMVDSGISLPEGVELLKKNLIDAALTKEPDTSVSQISLMTGLHRKDIKRFETETAPQSKGSAAARVLSLWKNDPDFQGHGQPLALKRVGPAGFDALVKRAKVDAAPATMLSVLTASGNAIERENGQIAFASASLVPKGQQERLQAAVATLRPHLDTTIGNLTGARTQWDQALRYSHLTEDAARQLEAQAAELALEMLQRLDKQAFGFQQEDEGSHLFVAGTFTHIVEQD